MPYKFMTTFSMNITDHVNKLAEMRSCIMYHVRWRGEMQDPVETLAWTVGPTVKRRESPQWPLMSPHVPLTGVNVWLWMDPSIYAFVWSS